MLTVLFVSAVLFGSYHLLSVLDGQRASSEMGSYLHYEYKASTLSQL